MSRTRTFPDPTTPRPSAPPSPGKPVILDATDYANLGRYFTEPRMVVTPSRPHFHARHLVFAALIGFLLGVVIRGMVG